MAFVTDSNRPQPFRQPLPTACLTASGAASEALPFGCIPWGSRWTVYDSVRAHGCRCTLKHCTPGVLDGAHGTPPPSYAGRRHPFTGPSRCSAGPREIATEVRKGGMFHRRRPVGGGIRVNTPPPPSNCAGHWSQAPLRWQLPRNHRPLPSEPLRTLVPSSSNRFSNRTATHTPLRPPSYLPPSSPCTAPHPPPLSLSGQLKNGASVREGPYLDRRYHAFYLPGAPSPDAGAARPLATPPFLGPYVFYDVAGREVRGGASAPWKNDAEGAFIVELLQALLHVAGPAAALGDVAVVSFYKEQVKELKDLIRFDGLPPIPPPQGLALIFIPAGGDPSPLDPLPPSPWTPPPPAQASPCPPPPPPGPLATGNRPYPRWQPPVTAAYPTPPLSK